MQSNIEDMNIKYSYIRTSMLYYREISEGRFFMDSFFKKNYELLEKYNDITTLSHTDYLEMFYDYQYEDRPYDFTLFSQYDELFYDQKQKSIAYNNELPPAKKDKEKDISIGGINIQVAKLNFHQENIRLSRTVIRDMYSLLYKLGIYDNKLYECIECKDNKTCWKRTLREKKNNNGKCKEFRTRIEE